MIRLTQARLVLITAVVVFAIVWAQAAQFVRVDQCLDHGGRYDYATTDCVGNTAPLTPARWGFSPRRQGALVGVAGLAVLFTVFGWRQRRSGSRPGV